MAGGGGPAPSVTPPGWALAAAVASGPASGWVATLSGAVPWSATPGGPVAGTLAARNPYGAAQVLGLAGRPRADGWALAELPQRPDGSTGWVQVSLPQVALSTTPYRIDVSLSARTLTLTDGEATVLRAPVAIGAARTPTPTATTYVWELIAPVPANGAYGPYVLGLGLYSNALATFNGGPAQIAIHGTDDPAGLGTAMSNGCVHVADDVVTELARTVPLGTPVVISA